MTSYCNGYESIQTLEDYCGFQDYLKYNHAFSNLDSLINFLRNKNYKHLYLHRNSWKYAEIYNDNKLLIRFTLYETETSTKDIKKYLEYISKYFICY